MGAKQIKDFLKTTCEILITCKGCGKIGRFDGVNKYLAATHFNLRGWTFHYDESNPEDTDGVLCPACAAAVKKKELRQ